VNNLPSSFSLVSSIDVADASIFAGVDIRMALNASFSSSRACFAASLVGSGPGWLIAALLAGVVVGNIAGSFMDDAVAASFTIVVLAIGRPVCRLMSCN